MPSSVSRTASIALNHATLPFVLELAEKGYRKACLENSALGKGLNVHEGHITHPAVALALQKPYTSPESLLRD
jgi:alanine dehydrogenase